MFEYSLDSAKNKKKNSFNDLHDKLKAFTVYTSLFKNSKFILFSLAKQIQFT